MSSEKVKKNNKSNKSSIIRVIISNFNDKEIKEIKVLYTKQAGVDTIKINKMELTKEPSDNCNNNLKTKCYKIKFCDATQISDTVSIKKVDNGYGLEVTKIDKYTNLITRKYKITAIYHDVKKDSEILKHVNVYVEDIINKSEEETLERPKNEKRRLISSTERLLLSNEIMNNYGKIINDKSIDGKDVKVDSQMIYKIRRFLSYRSNMLIYTAFLNDYLVKLDNIKNNVELFDMWEFIIYKEDKNKNNNDNDKIEKLKKLLQKENGDELLDAMTLSLKKNIHDKIENHNKYVDSQIEKAKEKKYSSFKCEKIKLIDETDIKSDLFNIINIFSNFRHKLMHYDYGFFDKLFTGNDVTLKNADNNLEKISNLLDLKMFNELGKIKNIKEDNKTTYIEDEDKIWILGKSKKLKSLYNLYNRICNRKNGFNNFINSLLVIDGVENMKLKREIEKHLDNRIEHLQKLSQGTSSKGENINRNTLQAIKLELKESIKIKEITGSAYEYDIHKCKRYKALYNEKKDLVAKQSILINNKNKFSKEEINDINKKLLKLKKEMEEITKLNAKFRLKYKLQLAYGFLYKEYGFDTKKFGDKFNTSIIEEIKKYKQKSVEYLNARVENDYKGFNINSIDRKTAQMKNDISSAFSVNPNNNLVKLYILIYLLIPYEIRGDFLGFVKKSYYDMKNIGFTSDKLIRQDDFFHKIRLFEKNAKKYEIINYSITEFAKLGDDLEAIAKRFGIKKFFSSNTQNEKKNTKDKERIPVLDKAFIVPMVKFYQNVFHLINDTEIHALINYSSKHKKSIKDAIIANKRKRRTTRQRDSKTQKDAITDNKPGNYNFTTLMMNNDGIKGEVELKENHDSKKNKHKLKKAYIGKIVVLRNIIAHFNYQKLFIDVLQNKSVLNDQVDSFIKLIRELKLHKVNLGIDFINDYHMKYEKLIFNLKSALSDNIINTEREQKHTKREELLKKEKKLLEKYKLDKNDLPKIHDKYLEIIETINNSKTKNKVLVSDLEIEASSLLGVYKKYSVKKIKKELLKLMIKNQSHYINVTAINYNTKENYNTILKYNYPNIKIIEGDDLASIKCSYKVEDNKFIIQSKGKYGDMQKEIKDITSKLIHKIKISVDL